MTSINIPFTIDVVHIEITVANAIQMILANSSLDVCIFSNEQPDTLQDPAEYTNFYESIFALSKYAHNTKCMFGIILDTKHNYFCITILPQIKTTTNETN